MLTVVRRGVIEEIVRALGYGNRVLRHAGLGHVRPDEDPGGHAALEQKLVRGGEAPAGLWHVVGKILSVMRRLGSRRRAVAGAAGIESAVTIAVVLIVEEEPNLVSGRCLPRQADALGALKVVR